MIFVILPTLVVSYGPLGFGGKGVGVIRVLPSFSG